MEYRYDIRNFNWIKEDNTFYADAWNLMFQLPDGWMHPEAFPNGKKQFYIHNNKTGGFRRFTFSKEVILTDKLGMIDYINWEFISEDGIKCYICVEENYVL